MYLGANGEVEMKKIVCVVITCVLLLGLCSCSSQKDKLPEFRHTTGETTAELAMGYLEYFGTNLKDRTVNGKTGNELVRKGGRRSVPGNSHLHG